MKNPNINSKASIKAVQKKTGGHMVTKAKVKRMKNGPKINKMNGSHILEKKRNKLKKKQKILNEKEKS